MSAETTSGASFEPPWLHVRREPFEYGLLPLPSIISNEGAPAFKNFRSKLLEHALPESRWAEDGAASQDGVAHGKIGKNRVGSAGIAASLELPDSHARLVLETLASVLPDEGADVDPLAHKPVNDVESVGADIEDVVLFLYIQTYKKVPPRPHKDAAAVADVWPTPSVFDGFLSPPSPIQTRSSRRTIPCQAEEEAHQLAFLQKCLPTILSLLAQSSEDGDQDAKVITLEKFQHLAFLLRAADTNTDLLPLSQATPFFANSDPDMPAVPVPLPQVLDWMLQHLCASSERTLVKSSTKENGTPETDEPQADVPMPDASPYGGQPSGVSNGAGPLQKDWRPEGITFVDGVTKASVVKSESDIKGGSVKVTQCHDSVVYVIAPIKYASVYGCSDSIVVLGAVGKAVRVEHCERVQIIVPCARICIANCRECLFNLGVNQRPLVIGDNHDLQVAPYNTFYPRLEAHMVQVGVDSSINKWDRPLTMGVLDPHDSISHSAGVADAEAEGASRLEPDVFTNFTILKLGESENQEGPSTRANPFVLPKAYMHAQLHRTKAVENLKHTIKGVVVDDNRKRDLTNAIHAYFKEWLFSTGNIRQIYDLHTLESDPKAMD